MFKELLKGTMRNQNTDLFTFRENGKRVVVTGHKLPCLDYTLYIVRTLTTRGSFTYKTVNEVLMLPP